MIRVRSGLAGPIFAVAAIAVAAPVAGAAIPPEVSFSYLSTGTHEQAYTVPAGVHEVRISATGAAGASNCENASGRGAQLAADLAVTPAQVLYVEVGQPAAMALCDGTTVGAGGWNGGADGGNSPQDFGGSGGGGASDVRTVSIAAASTVSLASRLIVAGGGGGASDSVNGGDAGSPGGNVGSVTGGGAGITTFGGGFGGAGGTSCVAQPLVNPGDPGTFGAGGAGGDGSGSSDASGGETGGGGGGGYYGGGGGGTDDSSGTCGAAGGGGGGSSFATASATNVTDPVATSADAGVTITPLVPAAVLSATHLTFTVLQAQDTVSAPKTVTVTNQGTADLQLGDVTTTGADAGDFLITGCRGPVAPGGSCQLQVRFVPDAKGARTATMQIFSDDPNSPATVSLAGTGGALPAGPQGPPGPRGKSGQVELIVCHTVTVTVQSHGKTHEVTQQKCTGRLISGPVKFTVASTAQASLRRGGRVYARGTATPRGVILRARRPIADGSYTLVLRYHSGKLWRVKRVPIVVR
jgi:Glycine rich protein